MRTYQHKDGPTYAKYKGVYIAWLYLVAFDRWACGIVWKIGDRLEPHLTYFGDTPNGASEEDAVKIAKRYADIATGTAQE